MKNRPGAFMLFRDADTGYLYLEAFISIVIFFSVLLYGRIPSFKELTKESLLYS